MVREEFLRILESIRPALTSSKTIVQGDCVAFHDGFAMAYADEISCRIPSGVDKKFTGAVPAAKLIEQLQKWKDREIDVSARNGKLDIVSGSKSRKAWFRVQKEIDLPTDKVEIPGDDDWHSLPKGFIDAVETVGLCAGKEKSKWQTTCVHVHPDWIEALSPIHVCRWSIKSKFKKPILVKQQSIRHIVAAAPDQFAETRVWVHFRNRQTGLLMSCRRYADVSGFPDATPGLEVHKASSASLSKVPIDEIERAAVFSAENDKDYVLVEIDGSHGRISGEGVSGGYKGKKFEVDWQGSSIAFYITPKILIDLCSKHQKVEIGYGRAAAKEKSKAPNRLKAEVKHKDGSLKYSYVTSLVQAKRES